jgi:hypothetical protein
MGAGHRTARRLQTGLVCLVLACLGLAGVVPAATAAAETSESDVGRLVFPTSSDQLGKPHRLTWFAEGRWWGVFRKSSGEGSGWRIWARDPDGVWSFGPEVLSTTAADRFDVALDPASGRVFAHQLGTKESRLLRLVFDGSQDRFVVDQATSVPTAYDGQASSITVDTLGRVWIVTHPGGQFAYTVRDGDTLAPRSGLTVLPDPVAPGSLVAGRFVDDLGPAVGFVYAEPGAGGRGWFKVQRDTDPIGTFSTEFIADHVDDHTTYAAAGSDVVVVWKDARDVAGEPIVLVRRRHPDGVWGATVAVFDAKVSSSSGNYTRPRIVLDADRRMVHVAAAEWTSEAAEIHERVAPIDSLAFGPQRVIFRHGTSEDGYGYRDVHAGQQPVSTRSGLLWLARGREIVGGVRGSFSLWEHHRDAGADHPVPTVGITVTSAHEPRPEGSEVGLEATVTGSSATAATVDWGDGASQLVPIDDGTVSISHTFLEDGEYTLTLTVDDPVAGPVSASVTQRVDNVPPAITAPTSEPLVTTEGTVSFDVTFDDPGLLDVHTVTVDPGDGTTWRSLLPVGERSTHVRHEYGEPGTYTLTIEVADDGGGRDTVTTSATVSTSTGSEPPEEPEPDPPDAPDPTSPAPPGYRGATTTNVTGSFLDAPVPADAQSGDLLLAAITVEGKTSVTAPPGWRVLRSDGAANVLTTTVYAHVVEPSSSAGSTRWHFSGRTTASAHLLAYDGVDPVDPVDAHAGATTGPRATTIPLPQLTTSTGNTRLVSIHTAAATTTVLPAADYELRTHVGHPDGITVATSDRVHPAAGPTGTATASLADPARTVSQHLALRPVSRAPEP